MMGGIIGSVLAAAGDAGVQSINQNIAQMNDLEKQNSASDLQMRNSLALLAAQKQAAIDSANQMRDAQAGRINSALPGVVDSKVAAKYAPVDTAVADAAAGKTDAPLTADQQAAIDQSKALDTKDFSADPQAYVQAAIKTGDIDPHTVAQLVQQDIALKRQEAAQKAQFDQSDKSQAASQAFQAAQQAKSQSFQAGQNALNREAMNDRADAKLKANMPPDDITDAEKRNWVHTYVTNNGSVPRSAPAYVRNSIGTWAAQMGITPDSIAKGTAQMKFDQASAVTSGHRGGSMAAVEATIPELATNAVDLSRKLGQGQFVPVNKLMQMVDDNISDPNVAAFKVAHQALASEYQTVISRGGTNVTALKEAMHTLNSARSQEAYEAAAKQVLNEVRINVNGTNKVRDSLGGSHIQAPAGIGNTTPNPFMPPAADALPDGWSVKVH